VMSLAGLALVACLGAADGEYAWPLDLPQSLTSSFGEYRTRKFHAGIDLRTGDAGKDVHAIADGYVSRVRSGPWGYGKAVYITLKDGKVVVYGHLSDFYPALREYVHKAQHAAHSYSIELTPKPDEFPVTRGQVVAKSGETGAGPPHLHYEIRDAQEQPLNPRMLGIVWPDTTPPVISKVLVAPASPEDRINGDCVPVILEAHPQGGNAYRTDPIHVTGRIGFGVDVLDPANENANQLGVHVLRSSAGGQEIFRIVHDRLNYDTIDNGAVSYHPFFIDKGHFLLQWRWPGNGCEIFQASPKDGWFTAPATPSEAHIDAEDFLLNSATVTVPLLPGAPAAPAPSASATTGRGKANVSCVGTWLTITATFTAPEVETPTLVLDGENAEATPAFHRVNASAFRAGYAPKGPLRETIVRVKHPRMADFAQDVCIFQRDAPEATVTKEDVTIRVRPKSAYGTLFWSVKTVSSPAPANGLVAAGAAHELWPSDSPIDAPVELTLTAPASGNAQSGRLRVYRNSGDGWEAQETKRDGDHFKITTRRFGTFAVMDDTEPPTLTFLELQGAQDKSAARPPLNIKVNDGGSGVAEVSATCDGKWLLMEYDPERNLAEWARDEDLGAGAHTVVFRAVDRAGNVATLKRNVARAKEAAPKH